MNYPKLLASLFLLAYIADECRMQNEQFAGPFRLILHQIGQCDNIGTGQIFVNSTRIRKVSRTKYLYSTNVTTEVVISDDLTAVMDISSFGNGGWRPNFMLIEFPKACSSMKTVMPVFYNAIKEAVGRDCPVSPGIYEIENLDIADVQAGGTVPNFPYGKYRADFSGLLNGTLVGCIRCYYDVVPAKRLRPKKKPRHI